MADLPLYSTRRLPVSGERMAHFILAERASTLAEAHGAAAEWRAITNDEGLSFYCRVEIVIPESKKRDGFYRIWVGPQERGRALLHLPGENVERRNDTLRAHLAEQPKPSRAKSAKKKAKR